MSEMMMNVKRFFGMEPAADARDVDDYADDRGYDRDDYRAADDRDYGHDGYADDYDHYDDGYGRRYKPQYEVPRYEPALREPMHHHITPRADFAEKYSEAREIGERFRDGDIVTFDLSELPMEQRKRYIDFAAGLSFALCGRIEADGNSFTLLPEGVEAAEPRRDALSG